MAVTPLLLREIPAVPGGDFPFHFWLKQYSVTQALAILSGQPSFACPN
jgi:hypothetical protein